jgi:PKD repeat protein
MKRIFTLIALTALVFSSSAQQCTELFFSEYIEGSSNNKALEIYNPTNNIIDLSTYQIRNYSNGSPTPSFTLSLTGTLNPREVYIVAHTSANSAILAVANQTQNGGVMGFNGNDALELVNSGVVVDLIGIVGNDPTTGWDVDGVTAATLNRTLVRKNTVKTGSTVWLGQGENQWNVNPQDDFSFLGTHRMKPCIIIPTGGGPICTMDLINLSVLISGGQTPYFINWDMGDGTVLSGQNVSHMYTQPGSYTILVTVTGSDGEFETETLSVLVNESPIVIASIFSQSSPCAPSNVCFVSSIVNAVPISFYMWDFGNGNTATAPNPCETYLAPGTYTATVIAVSNFNCMGTDQVTVNVLPTEDATFQYPLATYCINDANPTPSTVTPGGAYSSTTATVDAATGELNLTVSGAGIHVIEYVTSGACPGTANFTVQITSQFDATITPAGPFCEYDTPITLNAATSGGTWSGDGIVNASTGEFDPATAGVGAHLITYTISGNCGDTDNITVQVNAQDIITASNDTTICVSAINLSATPTGGIWSGADVTDLGNGQAVFSPTSATTYTATYTSGGQCPDNENVTITVLDNPVADFTYVINGNVLELTSTSQNSSGVIWSITENGNTQTYTTPMVMYTFTTSSVEVCIEAFTLADCPDDYCFIVNTGLSVESLFAQQFMLFPNPASGIITLSYSELSEPTVVNVLSIAGQQVKAFTIQPGSVNTIIDIEDLSNGIYILQLTSGTKQATLRFNKMD